MSREEVVATAFAIFVFSFAYRMLMGQILQENVGKDKLRDINYLLPWRVWVIGRYMKPYVKEYRFYYYIFRAVYYNIIYYRKFCGFLCFTSVSSRFCILGWDLASFTWMLDGSDIHVVDYTVGITKKRVLHRKSTEANIHIS